MIESSIASTLINVVILIAILILVLNSSSGKKIKIAYGIFNFSMIGWVITLYFFYQPAYTAHVTVLGRLTYIFIAIAFIGFYFFLRLFVSKDKNFKFSNLDKGLMISSVLLPIFLLTNFITIREIPLANGDRNTEFNYGIGIYLIQLFTCVAGAITTLVNSFKTANIKEKKQYKILIIGLLTTTFFGSFTNLVLPIFFNYFDLQPIGTFSLLILNCTIAFLIFKYSFLNIRLILGKVIYYLVLGVIPYFFFFILGFLYINLFGSLFNSTVLILAVPSAIIFIIIFNLFNNFLKRQVNTRFINPGYDPFEVVEGLARDMSNRLSQEEIAMSTISTIHRTIKPEFEMIVIFDEENGIKHDHIYSNRSDNNIALEEYKKLLFIWGTNFRDAILYQDIGHLDDSKLRDLANWLLPLKSSFEKDNIRLILPIFANEKIQGILILGSKEADSLYTQQDTELLKSINNSLGISLGRSFLYEQVKDANKNLQMKVDAATNDLKTQNSSLEVALDRLEKLRQQEQDMLDVMGHELRTPITIVRNALAVLKTDFEPDRAIDTDKLGNYLNKALESTRREMVLIETLLAATKIDANRIQFNLDKVDMISVVANSIEAMQPQATERNLNLFFEQPADLNDNHRYFAYADSTRLQEIQDNFVSNSVKYTMKGEVKIMLEIIDNPVSTTGNEVGEQEIGSQDVTTTKKNTPYIRVTVKDTGIGIPEDDIKRLGHKFFRARQYIKESEVGAVVRPGGTGLGLYVSFELIRMMNGEIEVQSKIGEGSSFSYTIPLYTGQEAKHIDQTFDSDPEIEKITAERKKRKLEAEDDALTRNDERGKVDENLNPGLKKISTADDIIKKISTARDIWEY